MKTLVDAGVEVCFSNPGTSEMHFVAALDSEPNMRAVLALFEGVATGAADGYARMADKPAATLLHLGCGLDNGLANLHNARKGKVPVINIVGDHATHHVKYDAQLQSDIETIARNLSPGFVRTSRSTESLCHDAVDAISAAQGLPGQVATLYFEMNSSQAQPLKYSFLKQTKAAFELVDVAFCGKHFERRILSIDLPSLLKYSIERSRETFDPRILSCIDLMQAYTAGIVSSVRVVPAAWFV